MFTYRVLNTWAQIVIFHQWQLKYRAHRATNYFSVQKSSWNFQSPPGKSKRYWYPGLRVWYENKTDEYSLWFLTIPFSCKINIRSHCEGNDALFGSYSGEDHVYYTYNLRPHRGCHSEIWSPQTDFQANIASRKKRKWLVCKILNQTCWALIRY